MRIVRGVAIVVAIVGCLLAGRGESAELPPGAEVADGFAAHITPRGVQFLEAQIPNVVPPQVAIPNQQGTLFSCLFSTNKWYLKNAVVYLDVTKASFEPLEGRIRLHLEMLVSASARFETNGCLFNNGCQVTLPPSPVVADTLVELALVNDPQTGRPKVDATVPLFDIAMSLADPQITECFLGGVFEFVFSLFHDAVEDAIVGAIDDQVTPLLEPLIEEAFGALNLAGSMELAGTEVQYDFYPTALEIHPGTIGLVMGGTFTSAGIAPCVDPDRGSAYTAGALPVYGDFSPAGAPYEIAASVSDDLLNQLLFSAWRGGLLCRTIDRVGDHLLTTDLLEPLGGGITRIVTPQGPMAIRIDAADPPLMTIGGQGGTLATVSLANLRIDLFADVEERLARLMRLKTSATAGFSIGINADNQLVTTLNFDATQVESEIGYNELAPDANEAILAILPVLVQQLVPSLLGDLPPIDLPSMNGIELTYGEFTPDGPQGDFLSAYTGLGGQLQAAGCGADLGGGCGADGGMGCRLERRSRLGRRADGAAPFLVSPVLLCGAAAWVAVQRRQADRRNRSPRTVKSGITLSLFSGGT